MSSLHAVGGDSAVGRFLNSIERTWQRHSETILLCAGCFVTGLLVSRVSSMLKVAKPVDKVDAPRETFEKNAFVLLVTIEFYDAQVMESFKELFEPMAAYVAQYEPTTISYECAQTDKADKHQVVIIERYVNREAYETIHRSSSVFKAFRLKLKEYHEQEKVTIHGHSYLETNIGFM